MECLFDFQASATCMPLFSTYPQVPKITINSKSTAKDETKPDKDIPSWRTGLRKTGSTSMVPHDSTVNKINEDDKNLPRSASSPRLAEEDENKKNEKNVSVYVVILINRSSGRDS